MSVVKLNMIQQIPTGLYDYFQMASIFFDRSTGRILKYTMSSQDGCGNTFMEYRRREGKHLFHYHSYFDDQGDSETILEDGEFDFLRFPTCCPAIPIDPGWRISAEHHGFAHIEQMGPPDDSKGLVHNRSEEARKVGGKTYPRVFISEVRRASKRIS